jgi:hypothetical protein
MVVDLCTSLGCQGDARVNPDRVVDGQIVRGQPWSTEQERGVRPESLRDAAQMVARRRLADQPFGPKTRARMEKSLAARIRRAYYRAQKQTRGDEPWREIEVGPAEGGIPSVATPYEEDED